MLSNDEWKLLRKMINAWPNDSDKIEMHRVINRERDPNQPALAWDDLDKPALS